MNSTHKWVPCDPDDNPTGFFCNACFICSCHCTVPSQEECPGEPVCPDDSYEGGNIV